MKIVMWGLLAGILMTAILWTAAPSHADVVSDWNNTTLNSIKADMGTPMKDALVLATVHAAVFDAVNSASGNYHVFRTLSLSAIGASAEAAAAAAAHRVLASLFPAQIMSLDEALAASLSSVPDGEAKDRGIVAGEAAADEIIAWRSGDATAGMAEYTPGEDPGEWRPTPPDFMMAMFPGWGTLIPFTITDISVFRAGPPPSLTSSEYVMEFLRTKTFGSKNSRARTDEGKEIAMFWMENPVRRWNMIAQQAVAQQSISVDESARLYALLNFALNDAQIAAWDTKYSYNRWRPITAIREADTDGNSLTDFDPKWEPLLSTTPAHPEYVSGHSTVSGAAAEILSSFFGTDDIAFTVQPSSSSGMMMKAMMPPMSPPMTPPTTPPTTPPMMPPTTAPMTPSMLQQPRSFDSFSEAVNEIGISRIYGGIHFDSSNETGKTLGRTVGKYVWENVLLVNNAPAEPAIVSPEAGASGVPYAPAVFAWTRSADPDSSDAVSYVLEYANGSSPTDWTRVEVPYVPEDSQTAGLGFGLASAALLGTVAVSGRKGSKILMSLLLMFGFGFSLAYLSSCGGDSAPGDNTETIEISVTLEPDTDYIWKVTASDSNGKSVTSAESTFTTQSVSSTGF